MFSGETKIQATTRPDNLWPEAWSSVGKAAQKKAKQAWANEKPKLEDARRLRGIYLNDAEDGDFKATVENARKELEVPMEAAMVCELRTTKRPRNRQRKPKDLTNSTPKKVEAHESTRQRLESSLPKDHADHIAGKGYNSMTHYNLVQVYSNASSDEDSGCKKLQWTRNGRSSRQNQHGIWENRAQKDVILGAQRYEKKVHFPSLMHICHLKNAELEPQFRK